MSFLTIPYVGGDVHAIVAGYADTHRDTLCKHVEFLRKCKKVHSTAMKIESDKEGRSEQHKSFIRNLSMTAFFHGGPNQQRIKTY
jgi:hypothetical protein